jgi:hypothetical protein
MQRSPLLNSSTIINLTGLDSAFMIRALALNSSVFMPGIVQHCCATLQLLIAKNAPPPAGQESPEPKPF